MAGKPLWAGTITLDDFEDLAGWKAFSSEGAHLEIAQDTGHTGKGMRLDFDLRHGVGFIVAHKDLAISLPENFEFRFRLRGEALPNTFQVKLIDSEGNVWWFNQPDFEFPKEWREVVIKKRHLQFAWGPAASAGLKNIAALEFAVARGADGKGSIWIDELIFTALEPTREYTLTPAVQASTSTRGHEPERVLDRDSPAGWRSGSPAEDQWLLVDFLQNREYGGLIIDWDSTDYATAYQVQVSNDGESWQTAYSVSAGNGGRDYIYMQDAESRYLRLSLQKSSRGRGYGISALEVKPLAFSRSSNHFFEFIARDAPRGSYPKYLYGEQSYWTIVGVSGDAKEGLLNEEGMLEVDKGAFSIEPFLYTADKLITWNEVELDHKLEKGYLPIPMVTWKQDRLNLRITAFAGGEAGSSSLYARYQIENKTSQPQIVSLFLAIRPFQVNPPWQNLNTTGGTSPIRELSYADGIVRVNRQKTVTALTRPERFGATIFDQGSITEYLSEGRLPPETRVSDPAGYASGALAYRLELPPGGTQEIYLAIPFYPAQAAGLIPPQACGHEQLERAIRDWEGKLNRVEIRLPKAGEKIVNTLKSTLAYILINRDGPAIQPGSRTYERSWIRDGSLTSSALLGMGHSEEVREFIKWYAQHQSASGKVPCCIDYRGADPTPEHDSHGEFIYLVMEYYHYTRDLGFLTELWPQVVKAVEYIDSLRRQRLSEEYRANQYGGACYGLLPESISHEGYSASPKHSYWDNFFTLRGLKDAVAMALILGEAQQAASFAALRDTFQKDLYASINQTIARRAIGYLPGCVELADFDPTSTAIAIDPGGELSNLPEPAMTRTFELYYEHFTGRRDGLVDWKDYSPYEIRIAGAMIRLDQKSRAHEVLDYFLAGQRPAAWNQWTEIVWRDPRAPRFIGDMPHTWVGSDFIRSARSLFAYEREEDQALVIAAGLPASWLEDKDGVSVKRLPTHHGTLNYTLQATGPRELRLQLSGDLALPAGNIIFPSPLPSPLQAVRVNGREITSFTRDSAIISEFPAEVIIRY